MMKKLNVWAVLVLLALLPLANCTSQSSTPNASSAQNSSSAEPAGLVRRSTPLETSQGGSYMERYYERKQISVDDFYRMVVDNQLTVQDGQMYSFQGTVGLVFKQPSTPDGEFTAVDSAKNGNPEDTYIIALNGSDHTRTGNTILCNTDQTHAAEVYPGLEGVIFEGRIETLERPDEEGSFYALHPCAFPGRQAYYSEAYAPEDVVLQNETPRTASASSTSTQTAPPRDLEYSIGITIQVCTKMYVEGMLVSPRSVKYPWVLPEDIVTKVSEGNYHVRSYLDAENAFGAMIRTYYTCDVTLSAEECSNVVCEFD